jgi:hypothetical protein
MLLSSGLLSEEHIALAREPHEAHHALRQAPIREPILVGVAGALIPGQRQLRLGSGCLGRTAQPVTNAVDKSCRRRHQRAKGGLRGRRV